MIPPLAGTTAASGQLVCSALTRCKSQIPLLPWPSKVSWLLPDGAYSKGACLEKACCFQHSLMALAVTTLGNNAHVLMLFMGLDTGPGGYAKCKSNARVQISCLIILDGIL